MAGRRALIVAPLYGPGVVKADKWTTPLELPKLDGGRVLKPRLEECLRERGNYQVLSNLPGDTEGEELELVGTIVRLNQLRMVLPKFFASDGGKLLFYFYGHGCLNHSRQGVFVTSDAVVGNEGLLMSEVIEAANQSQAREVVLILDCCHAGAAAPATKDSVPKQLSPGRILLAACAQHEQGWEPKIDEHKKLGAYSAHLLDGLEGAAADEAGRVRASRLADYVADRFDWWQQEPLYVPPPDGIKRSSFIITSGFEKETARWRAFRGTAGVDPERLKKHLVEMQQAFVAHMCATETITDEQAVGRYVELLVRERVEPGKEEAEDTERREGPLAAFVEEPGARLLVFGEGGSGKTTSLKKLASDSAARALVEPTAPIPVYVKLNAFDTKERGFDELLQMVSDAAGLDLQEMTTLRRKAQRPLLFLLDGFNEVGRDFQPTCALALQEFMRGSVHHYVVTTRPAGEAGNLARQVGGIHALDIVLLDENQIQDFLGRHGAPGLYERMGDRLEGLARNPFTLWALAQSCVGLPEGELPANIGRLYRAFIDEYIFGEREQSKVPPPTRYDYERVKKPVLAELAYRMTGQARTQVALDDDLEDRLIKWLGDAEEAGKRRKRVMPVDWTVDDFLNEAVHNGVLRQVGIAFEFMHQSVQEYFTAVELSSWKTEQVVEQTEPITWRHVRLERDPVGEPEGPFGVPVMMLSGLLDDSSDLIRLLSGRNPLLTAHCLGAATHVQRSVRERVIDSWLKLLGRRHERYRWMACVCLATAQIGDPEVAHLLVEAALEDEDYQVRKSAVDALERIDSDVAVSRLVKLGLEDEDRPSKVGTVLFEIGSATAVRLLFDAWRKSDSEEDHRKRAEMLLGWMEHDIVVDQLESVLQDAVDDNDHVIIEAAENALKNLDSWRQAEGVDILAAAILSSYRALEAVHALQRTLSKRKSLSLQPISVLIDRLRSDSDFRRSEVAQELGRRRAVEAITPLLQALWQETSSSTAHTIVVSLAKFVDDPELQSQLDVEMGSRDSTRRARAAFVLGMLGSREAIPRVIEVLQGDSETLSVEAAMVLGTLESKQAVVPLVEVLSRRMNSEVAYRSELIGEVITALGRMKSEVAVTALVDVLLQAARNREFCRVIDADYGRREWELSIHEALEESNADSQVIDLLREALKDPDSEVRGTAVRELGRWEGTGSQGIVLLQEALKDPDSAVRWTAVGELGRWEGTGSQGIDLLQEALSDADWRVCVHAVEGLGKRQGERAEHLLLEAALAHSQEAVRKAAAEALRWFPGDYGVHYLIDALRGPDGARRAAAAEALGFVEDEAAVEPLLALLDDPASQVWVSAAVALQKLKPDVAPDQIHVPLNVLVETAWHHPNRSRRFCAAEALTAAPGGTDALYAPITDALTESRYTDVIGLIGEEAPILVTDANLYWWRGHAYRELGRYKEALADYQQVTALVSDFADVHRFRASVFSRLDCHEEALTAAHKAAEIEPDNPDYQFLLGWYAYVAGAYEESMTASQRALELAPDTPMAAFNLGLALLASGQVDDARNAYQQGIEICQALDPEAACTNLNGALGDLDELAETRSELVSAIGEMRQLLEAAQSRHEDDDSADGASPTNLDLDLVE